MMIYQPAAMAFWLFIAIDRFYISHQYQRTRIFFSAFAIVMTALGLDFLSSKLLPKLLFSQIQPFERGGLVHDYLGKVVWFVHEVIPDSFALFSITSNKIIYLSSITIIILGIVFTGGRRYNVILRFFYLLSLTVLSYLPNLLVQENWASYRTQLALGSLVIFYVYISIWAISEKFNLRKIGTASIILLTLIYATTAHRNIVSLFISPQIKEYALIEKYLSTVKGLYEAQQIYLVPSHWENTVAPIVRYDEFGSPSSLHQWMPAEIMWVVLHSRQAKIPSALQSALAGPYDKAPHQTGTIIINFDDAIKMNMSQ